MKKEYEEPVIEVEWVEDIITASGNIHDNETDIDFFSSSR